MSAYQVYDAQKLGEIVETAHPHSIFSILLFEEICHVHRLVTKVTVLEAVTRLTERPSVWRHSERDVLCVAHHHSDYQSCQGHGQGHDGC